MCLNLNKIEYLMFILVYPLKVFLSLMQDSSHFPGVLVWVLNSVFLSRSVTLPRLESPMCPSLLIDGGGSGIMPFSRSLAQSENSFSQNLNSISLNPLTSPVCRL